MQLSQGLRSLQRGREARGAVRPAMAVVALHQVRGTLGSDAVLYSRCIVGMQHDKSVALPSDRSVCVFPRCAL
jgi:hypothetical protein